MEAALVDYSDSNSDSDNAEDHTVHAPPDGHLKRDGNLKRKRDAPDTAISDLPPLPASFHDLYASTTRVSNQDDPSMHSGRQRVTPHVEGSWPTHVYLEWHPSRIESAILSDVVSGLNNAHNPEDSPIHSLLKSDLGAELPLHISLSLPIMLLADQRQPFAELLERSILRLSLRPFAISIKGMDWVGNQEKTRWFLVLRVARPGNDGLSKLLRTTNKAVETFGQPPLYSPAQVQGPRAIKSIRAPRGSRPMRGPRVHAVTRSKDRSPPRQDPNDEDLSSYFHISIGWTLNPPSTDLTDRTRSTVLRDIMVLQIPVNAVKVKIGNNVTSIQLPTKVEEGRGLIGF